MKVGDRSNLVLGLSTVTVALAIAIGAVALHFHDRPLLKQLIQEDGPIENATAVSYLVAASLFLLAAVRSAPRSLCAIGFALMCFVVGGEEISWGQRLFGITTPAALDRVNVQHELNLHNIGGVHSNARLIGVLVQIVICVVIPLAWHGHAGWRHRLKQWRMPIASLWLAPVLAIAVALMAYPRYVQGQINQPLDETGEFIISLMMLAFAVNAARRINDREGGARVPLAYSAEERSAVID